jgi:hypothetical protein
MDFALLERFSLGIAEAELDEAIRIDARIVESQAQLGTQEDAHLVERAVRVGLSHGRLRSEATEERDGEQAVAQLTRSEAQHTLTLFRGS